MEFKKYPFERLNELLQEVEPNCNLSPISLTIGEPQFETPQFIQEELKSSSSLLNKYPKSAGEQYLKDAMLKYLKDRFNLSLDSSQIIPTFGTRELLFNFPQFLLFDKESPKMAFTNPFYQIYEGSAIASRAEVIYINLTKENNFLPQINKDKLRDCNLVILNNPNNPTSSVMSFESMREWVRVALEYDFVLLNDECYIDLYIDKPLPSLLEASIAEGNYEYKNILVANSISKRSSAPGLRSGFIAGDRAILKDYMKYRTYVGCASPLPLQKASALAWADQKHTEVFRQEYKNNLNLAKEILGVEVPEATFYLWLEVGDDLKFTKELFKEFNLKVLPGTFLSREGAGKGFVRLALVHPEEITKEALKRVSDFMKKYKG